VRKLITIIAVLLVATSCAQPITLRLKQTIDFNLNYEGAMGAPPNQRLEPGSYIAKPSDPVRADFTFAGWYCEQGCVTPWDFSTNIVMKPMTLYAKWTVILNGSSVSISMTGGLLGDYSVTFNLDAGMPIGSPHTSGDYPIFTVPRSALPLVVSVTSTPDATDYSWLLDGTPIASATSSIQLTVPDLSPKKHNLAVLLTRDADPYRSAAIILDTTD